MYASCFSKLLIYAPILNSSLLKSHCQTMFTPIMSTLLSPIMSALLCSLEKPLPDHVHLNYVGSALDAPPHTPKRERERHVPSQWCSHISMKIFRSCAKYWTEKRELVTYVASLYKVEMKEHVAFWSTSHHNGDIEDHFPKTLTIISSLKIQRRIESSLVTRQSFYFLVYSSIEPKTRRRSKWWILRTYMFCFFSWFMFGGALSSQCLPNASCCHLSNTPPIVIRYHHHHLYGGCWNMPKLTP